ncbi:ATP-binding protein [Shewanella sp. M16]|uniref:AAA family ATPase n=1 Tax=Shewanella sp. M16 TaxID=2830837 RepID=UPI001BAF3E3A|nr:AAA family ATPase [Shewanella sp. M16]MBS0044492.1 ATP-binding protein [Shewanella sp. M16]
MTYIRSFSSESFDTVQLIEDDCAIKSSNFKTVIIGENGTGKTRLLNDILSTVRELKTEKIVQKNITLHYTEKDKSFSNIVAISTSLNDKLPFSDNNKFHDDYYQYCGIRETSNASWTSSLMRKTIDNLLVCIEKNQSKQVKKILDFLDLSSQFRITFKFKNIKNFDLTDCSGEDLHDFIKLYSENTSRMQVDKIRSFSSEQAKSIIENFIPLVRKFDKNEYYIEVIVSNNTEGFVDAYENLDILRRVGLISSVSLSLSRTDRTSNYSFVDASSGEALLLHSLTAFIRYVSNNSLVIIDEPEISLHPNWQIKYFSLLNTMLSNVKNCHVIIATHSHFLISELDKESSSLISLKVVNGKVEADNIVSSTLGWSPESILYRVFNVRTFNSLYLESDLQKAHSMLYSDSCDFNELRRLNSKFQSLVLDDSDPLNKFIETVKGYINDNL